MTNVPPYPQKKIVFDELDEGQQIMYVNCVKLLIGYMLDEAKKDPSLRNDMTEEEFEFLYEHFPRNEYYGSEIFPSIE